MASDIPRTTANDMIIPLHLWDDVPYTRAVSLNVTLRFEEVLDIKKLHASLNRLLEIGDWRKLGARLRQNVKKTIALAQDKTTY